MDGRLTILFTLWKHFIPFFLFLFIFLAFGLEEETKVGRGITQLPLG